MAVQTTRWSPDTCTCVHEYQWDDAVPAEQRLHTPVRVVSHCANHAGLSAQAHFAALLDENPRKNGAVAAILSTVPALTSDDVSWSFNDARVLTITCPKLTTGQRNGLQTAINTKFGAGKVVLA